MALAREELVRVGEMFNTPDVISQAVSSLELALRDHTLLEVAGWPAARTEMLRQLVQDLQGRHATYAAKAGTKKATRAELLEELVRAKRWKVIVVAIGQEALVRGARLLPAAKERRFPTGPRARPGPGSQRGARRGQGHLPGRAGREPSSRPARRARRGGQGRRELRQFRLRRDRYHTAHCSVFPSLKTAASAARYASGISDTTSDTCSSNST